MDRSIQDVARLVGTTSRTLRHYDRLGLLVWTEVPNVASFTSKSANRMRETMQGILRRDRNHPSIIAWCLAKPSRPWRRE